MELYLKLWGNSLQDVFLSIPLTQEEQEKKEYWAKLVGGRFRECRRGAKSSLGKTAFSLW